MTCFKEVFKMTKLTSRDIRMLLYLMQIWSKGLHYASHNRQYNQLKFNRIFSQKKKTARWDSLLLTKCLQLLHSTLIKFMRAWELKLILKVNIFTKIIFIDFVRVHSASFFHVILELMHPMLREKYNEN